MLSDTTEVILEKTREANSLPELKELGIDIVLCKPSKGPLTDWTPATLDQLLAHDGLYSILHPTEHIACIDVDYGELWPIVQLLDDLEVPYVLEQTPRPGWHIWLFCARAMGTHDFNYCGAQGEIRTSDCYTVIYQPHLLVELLDSSRKAPPIAFFQMLLGERKSLPIKLPKRDRPKTARKRRRRKNSRTPVQKGRWRGTGRNNRLSAGIYASLKKRQPLDRHVRKAQLEGLPQQEIDVTVRKKHRQRARDLARREQALRENLRQHPLPKTRSDCKIVKVLRKLIDFALDSGLASPKRDTVAQTLNCCVTTISRHTKTLQENGNIAAVGVVVAAIHPSSGWEYRTNLWAIAAHTIKCHTKALFAFSRWVVRASDRMPVFLHSALSPLLVLRAPPAVATSVFV